LCHFDELQRDQGYRAAVEMPEEPMGLFPCHQAVLSVPSIFSMPRPSAGC
jgi:hypothetical protein